MPKIIVSLDTVVIKEVQLTKARTSVGRRPYNDVVIDNLAVSGEHAVIQLVGHEIYVEDLGSTNGTCINGLAIKRQLLQSNDVVEIGKYKIRCLQERTSADFERTMAMGLGGDSSVLSPFSEPASISGGASDYLPMAAIKVLSGAATGREVVLSKLVTTIGKPGVAVAAIHRKGPLFVMLHVEGANQPSLNGDLIGTQPAVLKNGDLIELAGIQMQFLQK
jgi:hypothetical protein